MSDQEKETINSEIEQIYSEIGKIAISQRNIAEQMSRLQNSLNAGEEKIKVLRDDLAIKLTEKAKSLPPHEA